MQLYPAALLKLLLPLALVASAYFSRDYIDLLSKESRTILDNLPYLLCVVVVFMGYQFNRSRLLLASLGLATFYWSIQNHLQVSLSDPEAKRVYLAMSLALPGLGLYLLLLPERGIWHRFGLTISVGYFLLGCLIMLLGPLLPGMNDAAGSYYSHALADGFLLSAGASAFAGLVVALGLFLLVVRNDETEVAIVGAFLALTAVLALLHLEHISVVMCTAAALCLVWGLLRSSHAMAYRDDLTGLPGRRALNERLKMLGSQFTIAMLDVDHFKRFNDTHGHEVGDQVLRFVASRIRRVGGGGTAYRYGGEEFCVVFPRRGLEDCIEPLQSVREEIAAYQMSIRDRALRPMKPKDGAPRRGATRIGSSQVSVTVSIGVASRSDEAPDAAAVIIEADKQLYRAKRAGRNRLAH